MKGLAQLLTTRPTPGKIFGYRVYCGDYFTHFRQVVSLLDFFFFPFKGQQMIMMFHTLLVIMAPVVKSSGGGR